MNKLVLGLFLTLSPVAMSAPVPKLSQPTEPVEIDFSPLPTTADEYRYKLVVALEAGKEKYQKTFSIDARTEPLLLRDMVFVSLRTVGWSVTKVGDTKLVVSGYDGKPVGEYKVTVDGLPKDNTPKVTRVKKDEKK